MSSQAFHEIDDKAIGDLCRGIVRAGCGGKLDVWMLKRMDGKE